jgi:hypothetical protein
MTIRITDPDELDLFGYIYPVDIWLDIYHAPAEPCIGLKEVVEIESAYVHNAPLILTREQEELLYKKLKEEIA